MMKNKIPSEGLRLGRDSGSILCDTLKKVAFSDSLGGVKIGSYVTISYGVTILTAGLKADGYPDICMCPMREHIFAPVTIGDGVWLCANSMVMPGVTIAPKIIVAAGSVVTKVSTQFRAI